MKMGYRVRLNVKSEDFPELGNPVKPLNYAEAKPALQKGVTGPKTEERYNSLSRVSNQFSSIGYEGDISTFIYQNNTNMLYAP